MHPTQLTGEVAAAQRSERLRAASRGRTALTPGRRRAEAGRTAVPAEPLEVTIRLARPADRGAFARLAQLDGRERGWGTGAEVLVAVDAGGALIAAVVLARPSDAIADPLRRSAGTVSLLRARAVQLRAADRRDGLVSALAGRWGGWRVRQIS